MRILIGASLIAAMFFMMPSPILNADEKLEAKEDAFLVCVNQCAQQNPSGKTPPKCITDCQRKSGLSAENVEALERPIGGGWAWSCPPEVADCNCSGVFDCDKMKRSKCCIDTIDRCVPDKKTGRETCYCRKDVNC
jgi:hypothetical protein